MKIDPDTLLGTRHQPESDEHRNRTLADSARKLGFSKSEVEQLRQVYGATVDMGGDGPFSS